MSNIAIEKLKTFVELSASDEHALKDLIADMHIIEAHQTIVHEGDTPKNVHIVIEGVACRYKLLPDGKRQILDFLIPGDICDGHMMVMAEMDHNVGTLTPCTIAYMQHQALLELTEKHPTVAQALWWTALVQESIAREWLVNVGRRPHDKRLAHLLCELSFRLKLVGLTQDHDYQLPVTQVDLADATGMSAVHANRVLQKLRREGLITLERTALKITDIKRLEQFAEFRSNYLYLGRHWRPSRAT